MSGLKFVVMLFAGALCGFLLAGIALIDHVDSWLYWQSGTMVSHDPVLARIAKINSFDPISFYAKTTFIVATATSLPPRNLKDFIAYAKANKGKLNYASVGAGSVPHLGGVLLNKAAGLDLTHVPYKGAGPATADLVAGQVELMVVTPPSVSGHIRSGAVKALALASEQRHPSFPDIPTTAEAGLPGFTLDGWFALFAPAGTPQPIVDKVNAAMRKLAKSDSVKARANQLGTVLKDWSPAEMDKFAKSEVVVDRKSVV